MKHHLFILPGLGDHTWFFRRLTAKWEEKFSIRPHILHVGWYERSTGFQMKLSKLIGQIETYADNPSLNVSLLGASAGASAAINIWRKMADRGKNINGGIIINCGRLRKGDNVRIRTLEFAARSSPAFRDSVLRCEKYLEKLTAADRKKILTFRPIIDEIVPSSTVVVDGAVNILLPSIEHLLSIAMVMTLYPKVVMGHIKKLEKSY